MKLSSKARYAVEAMFELALHPHAPVTLASIAEGQRISQSYMEQLFMRLRRAGLIEGARGPGGGYRLGKEADEITIAAIVKAVDSIGTRSRNKGAAADAPSTLMWNDLSTRIHDFLDDVTLEQLIADFQQGDATVTPISAANKVSRAA
jgi:Rrf2 family iron-sulfur cluster assembly transcriptional regulator